MAGVQIIRFSVPVTCICAYVTTLQQTNKQTKSSCVTKRMATVQVIHISLLYCHVLHPNNCAAVLNHIRSTVERQLYTDKDSRCGTLNIIIHQQSVHVYLSLIHI